MEAASFSLTLASSAPTRASEATSKNSLGQSAAAVDRGWDLPQPEDGHALWSTSTSLTSTSLVSSDTVSSSKVVLGGYPGRDSDFSYNDGEQEKEMEHEVDVHQVIASTTPLHPHTHSAAHTLTFAPWPSQGGDPVPDAPRSLAGRGGGGASHGAGSHGAASRGADHGGRHRCG